MKLSEAKKKVEDFFDEHGQEVRPSLLSIGKGKVYELYCLARTVEFLVSLPGVSVRFQGSAVDFKASPGMIDRNRSYFVVDGMESELELHTDIEVKTLSSSLAGGVRGPSSYHEIDVVLLAGVQDRQRPAHNQVILGVECKAQANFKKDILRQVLGVRRELSFYRGATERVAVTKAGSAAGCECCAALGILASVRRREGHALSLRPAAVRDRIQALEPRNSVGEGWKKSSASKSSQDRQTMRFERRRWRAVTMFPSPASAGIP